MKRKEIKIGDRFFRIKVLNETTSSVTPCGTIRRRYLCECDCGKIYKDRTGLWRHKKKCYPIDDTILENTLTPSVNDIPGMPVFDIHL